jgi:hypothetical protein
VTADPTLAPSTRNCTFEIVAPLAAAALALTVAVPLTVAPLTGDEIDTDSGVVLTFFTATVTPALVADRLFELVATAVNV